MAHKFFIRDVISLIKFSVRFLEETLLRTCDLQHIRASISQRLLLGFESIGTSQGCQSLRISGCLMGNHTSIVLIKSTDMY